MPERLKSNIIPSDGPLNSQMLCIGQSPGAEEDHGGKPFIGAAGQLLNRCLRSLSISRADLLITNIFRQRPPNNDVGYYFSDKSKRTLTWEGQQHVDYLASWIRSLPTKPNLILAFGYEAMYILTGRKRIWKWRGSILPCILVPELKIKVYVTLHPSHVNRLMNETEEKKLSGEKKKQATNALPLFRLDLKRAWEQSHFPELVYPERSTVYDLPYLEFCKRLEALNEGSIDSAVDIETIPGETGPILWCVGFATNPHEAFTIPFLKNGKFTWTLPEEAHILRLISRYFLNPYAKKIFQNGRYDLAILGRYYGIRVADGSYEDTMYCHHANYPYLRKALEVLTSIYTWTPYYKDEGKVNYGKRSGDIAEFEYNGKDCCVTREIWDKTAADARELDNWLGYRRTMDCTPSQLGMMLRGVRIDIEAKERLGREFAEKAEFHKRAIYEIEREEINLDSHVQVKKLLYYKYNLKEQYDIKSKKLTSNKDALNKLKRLYPENTVLQHLLEYRKFSKLDSTYTSMKIEADGRVRTAYSLVSTWRLNSSESVFGGGGNLQNIPVRTEEGRMVRSLFIPDPGKIFLFSDLSQAEARVVAWEANDLKRIRLFLEGQDVHWENAKIIFSIPSSVPYNPKALYKDPITNLSHTLKEYRNIGKTVVHAANYGMGPMMLQNILAQQEVILPFSTCRQMLHSYISRNPLLRDWHREVQDKIKAYRCLISSFGRKRDFLGRYNDALWRAAYAFSPQNTVGELLQVAIQRIWDDLPYYEPLLNVHDEVGGQCSPRHLPQAMKDVKERMEIPLEINGRELIIPCDFKVGYSWGTLKEVKSESDLEQFMKPN